MSSNFSARINEWRDAFAFERRDEDHDAKVGHDYFKLMSPTTQFATLMLESYFDAHGNFMTLDEFCINIKQLIISPEAISGFFGGKNASVPHLFALASLANADIGVFLFPELVFTAEEIDAMPIPVFLDVVFGVYLNRPADPGGLEAFSQALKAGLFSRQGVIDDIASSDEANLTMTGKSIRILDPKTPDFGMTRALRRMQLAETSRIYEFALRMAVARMPKNSRQV